LYKEKTADAIFSSVKTLLNMKEAWHGTAVKQIALRLPSNATCKLDKNCLARGTCYHHPQYIH